MTAPLMHPAELIECFVGADYGRRDLSRPFVWDDRAWATNRHWIVSLPLAALAGYPLSRCPFDSDSKGAKDFSRVANRLLASDQAPVRARLLAASVRTQDHGACPACLGTRRAVWADNDDPYDDDIDLIMRPCREGEAGEPCHECVGTGLAWPPDDQIAVPIFDAWLNATFCRALARVPGAVWLDIGATDVEPVLFEVPVFGGARAIGQLMPLDKSHRSFKAKGALQ